MAIARDTEKELSLGWGLPMRAWGRDGAEAMEEDGYEEADDGGCLSIGGVLSGKVRINRRNGRHCREDPLREFGRPA